MTTLTNLMLDTETMGKKDNAAVVSIGAVFFDEHTGQLGETFYRRIHLATSVAKGFVMDPGTVLWWLQQNDEARNSTFLNADHVEMVMEDFYEWVITKGPKKDDLRVWGCSPSFDCTKVANHLEACGLEAPWHYWAERCYRTIRDRNRNVPEDERIGLHNALDDAIHQAKHLIKIRHAKKASSS